jgi:hypothetical protein
MRSDLKDVPYDAIYERIAAIRYKTAPTARLKKGHFIDRVRINKPGEVFTKIEDISYIHDKETLQKHVGFGRSNLPGQAVFYGSVASSKMRRPREVAFKETSYKYKIRHTLGDIYEVFTMGRWRILDDVEVLEMIFSDEALNESEYVQASLENQRTLYTFGTSRVYGRTS